MLEPKARARKTPEQWMQDKLDKAKDPNTQYVKSTTEDTGEFINLLRSSDNLIYQLRMKVGRKFTFEQAQGFYERHRAIKEQLNVLNAEMCKVMDWDYNPPRGYDNPFPRDKGEKIETNSKTPKIEKQAGGTV
jgi:hypothetical protein